MSALLAALALTATSTLADCEPLETCAPEVLLALYRAERESRIRWEAVAGKLRERLNARTVALVENTAALVQCRAVVSECEPVPYVPPASLVSCGWLPMSATCIACAAAGGGVGWAMRGRGGPSDH